MSRLTAARRPVALTDDQLTVAWQAASLLLGYPDAELLNRLELVRRASLELPDHVEPMAVVPLGWPTRPLGPPRREPASAKTHREVFDASW